MNTDQVQLFTAVRSPYSASAAFSTAYVRFDGTSIARTESLCILRNLNDFARQFMPQDARIGVDRMPSCKSMEVATTNPDSMNSKQGLSTGRHWARDAEVD